MGTTLDSSQPERLARPVTRHDGNRRATSLLRRSRLLRHWTLEQAADALFQLCTQQERRQRRGDINAKMISAWERGRHVPDAFWREKLCRLYEASAEELGFVEPVSHQVPSSVRMSAPLPGERGHALPVIVRPSQHVRGLHVLEQRDAAPLNTQASAWLLLGVDHLAYLFDEGWSVDDILTSLQTVLQGVHVMSTFNRRHLLKLGAAAVVSGVAVPATSHVTIEERVHLCQALGESLAAGWQLFHRASTAQVLAVGQAHLYLIQQASSHLFPTVRPIFYASAYNLIGAAYHFHGRYPDAYKAHEQAYVAALEGTDALSMAQSRLWQANGLREQQQYQEALQTIEAAVRLVSAQDNLESIRLQAHLFASGAELAALVGNRTLHHRYLDASRERLEHVPYDYHDEFDHASWHQYKGTCALILKQYATATEELQMAMTTIPPRSLIRQVITLMPLAIAYARQREREQCLDTIKQAAAVVKAIRSPSLCSQFVAYLRQEIVPCFTGEKAIQAVATETERSLASEQFSTVS
jgi:tetratricopeptide (TPR) repeat protein